ncbi:MAG: hypothetical protein ACYCWE_06745 [Eubacteriales bacterium]
MDNNNNKNEKNKPQENQTQNQNTNPNQPVPADKYRTLKIVGIVLLVLIGIPILIFGICILLLTS